MSIREGFEKMVGCVLDEYGKEMNSNKEYNIALEKYTNLYNRLKKNLSDEDKFLLEELDEATNNVDAISSELTYKKGLQDGIELKNILKIVS